MVGREEKFGDVAYVSNTTEFIYANDLDHHINGRNTSITFVLSRFDGRHNGSKTSGDDSSFDNPFDYPAVKVMFILLYSVVFLVCCVGNSLVLYTIGRTKRMRTRTNFFLANLAVADLGVGLVCILPKLSTFLSPAWILGERAMFKIYYFPEGMTYTAPILLLMAIAAERNIVKQEAMCKIYYFAQGMTYTASILLLMAIATERYIAILHPLRSRCVVTHNRLIFAQIIIWVISAAYNSPELSMFNLVYAPGKGNGTLAYCFPTQPYANMRDYYTVNFVLWYVLPLSLMTFMYMRVSCTLWKASRPDDRYNLHLTRLSSRGRTNTRQETVLGYVASVSAVHTRKLSHQRVNDGPSIPDTVMRAGDANTLGQENGTSMGLTINRSCNTLETSIRTAASADSLQSQRSQNGSKYGDYKPLPSSTTRTSGTRQQQMCSNYANKLTPNTQLCAVVNSNHQNFENGGSQKKSNGAVKKSSGSNRKQRLMSCDFTWEVSDVTSSDEYDMLAASNGNVSRRVRCQYRMNSQRVLTSRRRVIRLLVVVLLTFAICVFPFHIKFLIMFWEPSQARALDILSPLSYVMLYANSALNPILYWVFTDTFRRSLKDACYRSCRCRRGFR